MKLNKKALAYILMSTLIATSVPTYADTVSNQVSAVANEAELADLSYCKVIDMDYGGFKIQSGAFNIGGKLELPPEVMLLSQDTNEVFVIAKQTGSFNFKIVDNNGNELSHGTIESNIPTSYGTPLTITQTPDWENNMKEYELTLKKSDGVPIGWIKDESGVKLITTSEAETTVDISSKSLAEGINNDIPIDLGTYSSTANLNFDSEGPVITGIDWSRMSEVRGTDQIALWVNVTDAGSGLSSREKFEMWRIEPGTYYVMQDGITDSSHILGTHDVYLKDNLGNKSNGFKPSKEDIKRIDDLFPKEVQMEVTNVQPGADGSSVDITLASTHALGGGRLPAQLYYHNNESSNITFSYYEHIEDSFFELTGPKYDPFDFLGSGKDNTPKDTKDYTLEFNYKIPTWMPAAEGDGLGLNKNVNFLGYWDAGYAGAGHYNFSFNATLPDVSLTKFYPDRVPIKFKEGTRHYYEPGVLNSDSNHRSVWVKSEDDFLGIDASNTRAWFDLADKSAPCHSTDIDFSSITLSDKEYPEVLGPGLSYSYDNFSEINQVIISNPYSFGFNYPYASLFTIYPEVDDQAPEIDTPVGYRKGDKVEITINATDTLPIDEGNKVVELLNKEDEKTYTFTDAVGNVSTITVRAWEYWDNKGPENKPPHIEGTPKDTTRDDAVIDWIATDDKKVKEVTLPDGTKVPDTEGKFPVHEDGDYKFIVEDEDGLTDEVIVPVKLLPDNPPTIQVTSVNKDKSQRKEDVKVKVADDWALQSVTSVKAGLTKDYDPANAVKADEVPLTLDEGTYIFTVTDDRGQTATTEYTVSFDPTPAPQPTPYPEPTPQPQPDPDPEPTPRPQPILPPPTPTYHPDPDPEPDKEPDKAPEEAPEEEKAPEEVKEPEKEAEPEAEEEKEPERKLVHVTFFDNDFFWYRDDVKQTREMLNPPEWRNNNFYIPVRYLHLALDLREDHVVWDPELRAATVKDGQHTLTLFEGSLRGIFDGQEFSLDASVYVKNGRTMLPVQQVLKVIGHRDPLIDLSTVDDGKQVDLWFYTINADNSEDDKQWYKHYLEAQNNLIQDIINSRTPQQSK